MIGYAIGLILVGMLLSLIFKDDKTVGATAMIIGLVWSFTHGVFFGVVAWLEVIVGALIFYLLTKK